jgi:alpha-L-fucosidase 2
MKKIYLGLWFILGLPVSLMTNYLWAETSIDKGSLLKLWYLAPATRWEEALPVGNGRLGAMIYGQPGKEQIQLNESTIWAGQPNRNDNSEAKEALPVVRQLVFEGKYNDAQALVNRHFISKASQGMPYQTAGNLILTFPGHEKYTHYYRELDIEKAIATTSYEVNGIKFRRQSLATYPDQVLITKLSANKAGSIHFMASLERPGDVKISVKEGNKLVMEGITSDHESVKGGVRFQVVVQIIPKGGTITASTNTLTIDRADEAMIIISIGTNFVNYQDITADP